MLLLLSYYVMYGIGYYVLARNRDRDFEVCLFYIVNFYHKSCLILLPHDFDLVSNNERSVLKFLQSNCDLLENEKLETFGEKIVSPCCSNNNAIFLHLWCILQLKRTHRLTLCVELQITQLMSRGFSKLHATALLFAQEIYFDNLSGDEACLLLCVWWSLFEILLSDGACFNIAPEFV